MKFLFLIILLNAVVVFAGPKYGANAIPLSKNSNHSYFVKNKAPDFWALISFYSGQETESSCSSAALVTVLNGARRGQNLSDQDELVTHKSLTEKYTDEGYKYAVCGDAVLAAKNGVARQGVSVARLAQVLDAASKKLKFGQSKTVLVLIDLKNIEKS